MLEPAEMCEFTSLERCAAYVAARTVLTVVQRTAPRWPAALGDRACRAAIATAQQIAQAIAHDQGTAERRRHLRGALASALTVAAAVDLAAVDLAGLAGDALDGELDELTCVTGRTIALLGMLLHASTTLGVSQRMASQQERTTHHQRARRK